MRDNRAIHGRIREYACKDTDALFRELLRQYMHNTENAVTMRLSTILKTIKQPL